MNSTLKRVSEHSRTLKFRIFDWTGKFLRKAKNGNFDYGNVTNNNKNSRIPENEQSVGREKKF